MSGLSGEDRARIQHWIRKLRSAGGSDDPDATALSRALAHIDHLERALREIADRLPMGAFGTPISRAQEIARAALRTSEDAA